MSDYRMDIRGDINLSDYSSIHDYMGIVGQKTNSLLFCSLLVRKMPKYYVVF
ncbi:hypothetical protein [Clostridium sp. Marseille-Q7071]